MVEGNLVGVSETLGGSQEAIEKALEYTRRWRGAATVNYSDCAVVVCNEVKDPGYFK